jgi:flagellar motor switch protein FliM
MNPGEQTESSEALGASSVDSLLDAVAEHEQLTALAAEPQKDAAEAYDFRNPSLLSPREMRKLRIQQEEFIQSLASRLASHLRFEFSLRLSGLRTIACQKFAESWANPTHLTLFKIEPLRGVAIMEISFPLGSMLVDRLMGGPGHVPEVAQEMSEIEKALLEQVVQVILDEWCAHWPRPKELKPSLLGYESNGRFVQVASSETIMLVLGIHVGIGEHAGFIQIGIPFTSVEPLIKLIAQSVSDTNAPIAPTTAAMAAGPRNVAAAPAAPANKWNAAFDEVRVPMIAEWHGLELSVRDILALKVGDVVQMEPQNAQRVNVRLDDVQKFVGRPGSLAGHWAVELTQAVKS